MSETEKKMDRMSREEFDVDTGTYMEDVHMNDHIIGIDGDSDGLIDDVEKLVEDATKRADAYNEEKQSERERAKAQEQQRQVEKEGKDIGL